jgi:hypothetical protein
MKECDVRRPAHWKMVNDVACSRGNDRTQKLRSTGIKDDKVLVNI